MRRTVVAVNAHPDDEAILMGGTVARASAQGHRVILVTATDGGADPAAATVTPPVESALGARRLDELKASAAALGAHEIIDLGYADSGMGPLDLPPNGERQRLHTVPVEAAAQQVAEILTSKRADLLIGYDRAGGYGHRDHVQIHHIVRRAAQLRDTRLLEATAPREPIAAALTVLARMRLLGDFDPQEWSGAFTPQTQITHRIDVRGHLRAKRAALAAHASQAGTDARTLARVLALPAPVFTRLLGREFFIEPGRRLPRPSVQEAFVDLVGVDSSHQKHPGLRPDDHQ